MSLLFAETSVELADPEAIVDAFQAHFAEHLPMVREGATVRFETEYGNGTFSAEKGRFAARVNCVSENVLLSVKSMVAEHIIEFSGDKTLNFSWTGDGADQQELPNLFMGRVVRAFNVTPLMRRVVIAIDGGIERLMTGGLHVRILLVPKGRAPVWPHLSQTGAIVWPEGDDALVRRVYTIRSGRAEDGEIDLDFVMHEGDHMPGAHFGATAAPGDLVGILGPGGGTAPDVARYVFAGDETALPVIARMVEEMPAGKKVTVFAEVASEAERQDIASAADVEWNWLYRNGKVAGTSGLLETALRSHDWGSDHEGLHVFVGCEKSEARSARKLLIDDLNLPKASVRAAGYWTIGVADDH